MANRTVAVMITGPQYNEDTFDIGDVKWSARKSAPGGWLAADGSAVSRSTYAGLFAQIITSLGTFTVTLASPGVFTLTGHGLSLGDSIYLTTTGALPTGLAANTLYYVVSVPTADTFSVSATQGGTAINTSGSQSGTHTAWWCPHGLGDGSTTFNLPHAPVSGRVTSAGTILEGAGYTVNHSATGVYVVTFSPAFIVPPKVIVGAVVNAGGNRVVAHLQASPTASGFTTFILGSPDPNSNVDAEWAFTAGGDKPARNASLFVKYA